MFFVLKSSDVLDVTVPILHYLTDARADHTRVGLMHICKTDLLLTNKKNGDDFSFPGVFLLLLLSGERNFGVRLNKHTLHPSPWTFLFLPDLMQTFLLLSSTG